MSDKHAQMREMARGLIRDSVIEDAIAQKIAQIVEFIHENRIKPLQERVELLERERALDEIAAIEEDAPKKQVHWAKALEDKLEKLVIGAETVLEEWDRGDEAAFREAIEELRADVEEAKEGMT